MPVQESPTSELLTAFGYDSRIVRLLTLLAYENKLSHADLVTWIDHINASQSIRNPQGFLRSVITRGDKPARAPSINKDMHEQSEQAREQYPDYNIAARLMANTPPPSLTRYICSQCNALPCLCDWDPNLETRDEFRARFRSRQGENT